MGLMRQILLKRCTETHNDSPETAVRPFDADADGTVVGEGGGLFILEEYEHAKARGAKIYAELVGFGASQDTYSITEPDPNGHSYGKAIAKALADANLPPTAVDLLVPCGLGIAVARPRRAGRPAHSVFGGGLERVALSPRSRRRSATSPPAAASTPPRRCWRLHHSKIPRRASTRRRSIDGPEAERRSREARDAK